MRWSVWRRFRSRRPSVWAGLSIGRFSHDSHLLQTCTKCNINIAPSATIEREKVMSRWTTNDIPPQRGRSVVVTGTGGLGFQDALALARAGAEVIIAGRNPSKGAAAVAAIRKEVSNADVRFEAVDLASLSSIAA